MTLSRTLSKFAILSALFAVTCLAQDPPSRVARLNYIKGNVSMDLAGEDDWWPAVPNRPFTIGDGLYTDYDGKAELHMDVAVMRVAPQTTFGFENLDDQSVQIRLTEGTMNFRIRNLSPDQIFEIDTPNAAFTLLRNGVYRFDVDPNGNTTFAVVRQGQLEVTGGGQAFTLDPGNSAYVAGTDQLSYDVEVAPYPDDFDNWCSQRDDHEAHLRSFRFVSPTMIGYEDLDDHGDWQVAGEYGNVWYPRELPAGWAPYHNGHWAWVQPWGWTWVDDAPWGFAPFHYGRWAYVSGRWGWCPGPVTVVGYGGPPIRAHYAPALVAFFGGAHFGVSLSIGGGGGASMGWVALGFGEVYTPPYHVSQNYFRNVNVSSTTISNTVNITNVYNTTYVHTTNVTNVTVVNHYSNMSAPGAVTAMPQSSFASGRPVAQNAVSMTSAQVANIRPAQASVLAPSVAPTRQALAPMAGSTPAAHPSAQLMARAVVAKTAPPPPAPSFAAQQSYLQQHPGQPINNAAIRQSAPARPAPAVVVKQAPAAHAAVAAHPGQRVGNPPVVNHPAGQPAQYNKPAAASQPAAPSRPAAAAPSAVRSAPANAPRPAVPASSHAPNEPSPAARTAKPSPVPAKPATPAAHAPTAAEPKKAAPKEPAKETERKEPAPAPKAAAPVKSSPPASKPAAKSAPPAKPATPPHGDQPAQPKAKKSTKEEKSTKEPQ